MAASKKRPDFRAAMARDPAAMFISSAEEPTEAEAPAPRPSATEKSAPAPIMDYIRKNTPKHETRSRRLQLLMKPSLYARLKETADSTELSVNELINAILEKVLEVPEDQ